jgi:hypothetical protein
MLSTTKTEKELNMGDKHTPGDWDFDNGFIVAPDPSGKHPDIYIAEIATEDSEGRIAPDEQHYPNGRLLAKAPQLLKSLERAFEILEHIADVLFYQDGQPVTVLEAGQIEEIYIEAISEFAPFETLIRQARGEQ